MRGIDPSAVKLEEDPTIILEILKELEPYTGRFPMRAMKAAIEPREAITPELLTVLESVTDDPAKWADPDHACCR